MYLFSNFQFVGTTPGMEFAVEQSIRQLTSLYQVAVKYQPVLVYKNAFGEHVPILAVAVVHPGVPKSQVFQG